MKFNEEILTEARFTRMTTQQQLDVIAEYCQEVESQIRAAKSHTEALQFSKNACKRFEEICPSKLLQNTLTQKLENIISLYWNDKRTGK